MIDAAKMFAGLGPDPIPRIDNIGKKGETGKKLSEFLGPEIGNLVGDVKVDQDYRVDQLTGEFNATYTVWDLDLDTGDTFLIGQKDKKVWRPIGDPTLVPVSEPYVDDTRWWFEPPEE